MRMTDQQRELKWHLRFLRMADEVASWSKDRSTKVGAVLVRDHHVIATGYNGFPRQMPDGPDWMHDRPAKYDFTVHAEMNTLMQCCRYGHSAEGCTLYINFFPLPCSDCTKHLIQAGVSHIVGTEHEFTGRGEQWERSLEHSKYMLDEAGVLLLVVSEESRADQG